MLDLNQLVPAVTGRVLTDANKINNNGQIAVLGTVSGQQHVFRLTPVTPIANPTIYETGDSVVGDGKQLTVKEGVAVTLDGSASSAPGCSAPSTCPSFKWSPIPSNDTTITLNGATTKLAALVSPNLPVGIKNQVYTFALIVKDELFSSSPATVSMTVQHENIPPVAVAGDAQTVKEGSPVTLDGNGSYDADGINGAADYLAYAWTNPAVAPACASIVLNGYQSATPSFTAPAVGSDGLVCTFDLVVTDANGAQSAAATAMLTIANVNHPPVASAGDPQTVNEGDTPVILNGSGSSDPDGDSPLTYRWTQQSGTPVTLSGANTASPTFTAPQVGPANDTLGFQLTVGDRENPADPQGLFDTDSVTVTGLDKSAPPTCDKGKLDVDDFWPPNHKMTKVEIEGLGEDRERVASGTKQTDKDRDDVFVQYLSVTQDEPTSGLDSNDSSPDAAVMRDDGHDRLLLRRERAENGNGRVYWIRFGGRDKSGQYCEGLLKACVPSTKSKKVSCVDDGQKYNSYLK